MKKVFLTFGDGGEQFVAARERIVREAIASRQFNEVVGCDWSCVSPEVQRSPLRHCKRGCGYWVWKPDIIFSALSRMEDGDVLVYCDAGCVVNNKPKQWCRLFARLETADLVLRKIRYCAYQWTSRELFSMFRPSEIPGYIHMCFQFEASVVVLRKSAFSMNIIERWRAMSLNNPSAISDPSDGGKDELPGFVQHRHDQSLLTLLVYKALADRESSKRIDVVWDFHSGLNLLGDSPIDVARKKGDAVLPSKRCFRSRVETALHRMLWLLQRFLESKGVSICWTRCRIKC